MLTKHIVLITVLIISKHIHVSNHCLYSGMYQLYLSETGLGELKKKKDFTINADIGPRWNRTSTLG